ncbi:MAG: hypothetical protein ABIF77_10565, partial [bacterium]
MYEHPVVEPLLWLRFLLGAGCILGLPGYLLLGRFLTGSDLLSRVVLSFAAGLVLVTGYAFLADHLSLSVRFYFYLPVVIGLSLLAGRHERYRATVAHFAPHGPPLSRPFQVVLLAICLTM